MLQTVGLLRSLAAAANSASETCLAPVKVLFKSCSKPNFDVCRKLPKCAFAQYLTTIFKFSTCVRFFKNVIDLQIAQISSKKEPIFDVCQICQILAGCGTGGGGYGLERDPDGGMVACGMWDG